MASPDERMKILRMIQEGKITASEGMQLLDMLHESQPMVRGKPETVPSDRTGPGAQWLRVRVTDRETGRVRVNVRLPVSVLNAGFKLGACFSPQIEGLESGILMDAIRSGETGLIADIYDDADREHVEIFLE